MHSIARVKGAIRHQPGVPLARGELTLDRKFAHDLLNWRKQGPPAKALADADLLIACCRALNLDLVCIQSPGGTAGETDPLGKPADIPRMAAEGLFVFWIVDGSFQRAMARQGALEFLQALAAAPDAVHAELQQLSRQVLTAMAQGVAAGARGIIIADDIAYRQSTYLSPDFVRQYLLPIWQTQVTNAGNLGVPVFFHSDGNINAILPTLVEAGFDGLQCIEPAAGLDIRTIKQQHGKTLCLMGSLDPALLSGKGDPRDTEIRRKHLRRAVLDLMELAGEKGGLILGTCSGLHAGMSPELVQYMYDLAIQ